MKLILFIEYLQFGLQLCFISMQALEFWQPLLSDIDNEYIRFDHPTSAWEQNPAVHQNTLCMFQQKRQ